MDNNSPRLTSGAEAIVESLIREGVDTVFGYPGAAVLPLYNALSVSGVRHILTRTEQGAGHAASGYARISGKPGVCIATSGPGATNLFTAIATAYGDSIPLVAITGQAATYKLGRDVFQEIDTTGAAEPFTKYTYLVKSASSLGRVMKEAFHISSTGRKGPVLIDVPVDVQLERAEVAFPDKADIRGYKPRYRGNALQVKRVAEAIMAAERPLLCFGGGIFLSGAEQAALDFCECADMPAVTTLMGVGALPADHRLCYGMLGPSGGAASRAAARSDLLIIIGARVGDRAFRGPSGQIGASVVHIDIDPAEIGKNVGAAIPLVGDAALVMGQLMEREITGSWPDWISELDGYRQADRDLFISRPPPAKGVDPARFLHEFSKMLPGGAVYIADVGQNQVWAARNNASNARFLTSGGMGTMGYSLPAAIGAGLACPGRPVFAVIGDGAFQMAMGELATIKSLGLPVKIVLINNNTLGLVREMQVSEGYGEYAVDLSGGPDYRLIAEAYGIRYAAAESLPSALDAARAMLDCEGAYLLECSVDRGELTI